MRRFLGGLAILPARLRAVYYRFTSPVYVRKIGCGTVIFGRLKIARPFSHIVIGARVMIGEGVFWQVSNGAKITMGDDSSINRHSVIVSSASISIGRNVAIAEMVSIRDSEHRFSVEHGVNNQGYNVAPIVIEDNVWIGRSSYIAPGTHIRKGSIVGANSVVRGSFPAGVLIAGAPAKVKKSLLKRDLNEEASENYDS